VEPAKGPRRKGLKLELCAGELRPGPKGWKEERGDGGDSNREEGNRFKSSLGERAR